MFDTFVAIDYFGYFMGHMIFSMHYLKTSLILPKLLKEAKLEWLVKDAQRNSTDMLGWDLQKINEELPLTDCNLAGTLNKVDEVIKTQK